MLSTWYIFVFSSMLYTCRDIKRSYKITNCCNNPSLSLNMNISCYVNDTLLVPNTCNDIDSIWTANDCCNSNLLQLINCTSDQVMLEDNLLISPSPPLSAPSQ